MGVSRLNHKRSILGGEITDIRDNFEQSLKEMKEIREGKREKKSWIEFMSELTGECIDGNNELKCKYCGSTHAVYWKTQVCIDCALAHGLDK